MASQDDVYVTARRFCEHHDKIRLGYEQGYVVTQRSVTELLEQDRQDTLDSVAALFGERFERADGTTAMVILFFVADGSLTARLAWDGNHLDVPVGDLLEDGKAGWWRV